MYNIYRMSSSSGPYLQPVQSNACGITITPTITNPGAATTVTLTAGDSGKLIKINPAQTIVTGNTLMIYLPVPSVSTAGIRYKFVLGPIGTAITANTVQIRVGSGAGTVNLIGVVSGNVTAATGSTRGLGADTAGTTLSIVVTTGGATGASLGDSVDIWCDGINWYYSANVALVGALTVA